MSEHVVATRPTGVRIVHRDGTEVPVELAYQGDQPDGLHVWACMTPVLEGDLLKVAVLPGHTAITFPTGGTT